MSRKKVRLLTGVIGVFVMLMGGLMLAQPASAANGCYGDYCSGRNPYTTGVGGVPCYNDSYIVSSADINSFGGQIGPISIGGSKVGVLELRWSPRCQTNWARLNIAQGGNYRHLSAVQDTGYEQVNELLTIGYYYLNPGIYTTNMIYSPVHAVQAKVNTPPWWVATTWV